MKEELTAVSIFGRAVAHVLVSAVTTALGASIAAWPRQAATIWGSQRLKIQRKYAEVKAGSISRFHGVHDKTVSL
jgi:hypothetical protein